MAIMIVMIKTLTFINDPLVLSGMFLGGIFPFLVSAMTMTAVGESFNLGKNLGLDLNKLFDVISTSTGSCWAINSYCPIEGVGPKSPADNGFKPGFSVNLMYKDLNIALKAIESTGTSACFGKKAQESFKKMVDEKKGSLDFSAITMFNK